MSRPRIVVVGSSNTDLVVNTSRIPKAGETVLGDSFLIAPGGKGANQATAAARLGAAVTFVGRVGKDPFGKEALKGLKRERINTEFFVQDAEAASGVALVVVDPSGENAIAVAPGANRELSVTDVEHAKASIQNAHALLLQLETPIETVRHAAMLAADAGVLVILNPAPAQTLDANLLQTVTVLTPNQHEAKFLARPTSSGDDSLRTVGKHLQAAGAKNVIITLGSQGALLITERHVEQVQAPQVTAVDTTAAGDAFNGALAYALGNGESLPDATRFATVAGAVAATRRGAQPSLPTQHDIDAFVSKMETGTLTRT